MSSNKDTCENCVYCVANMDNKVLVYACKRYPPTPVGFPTQDAMGRVGINVMSLRPQVSLHDVCGEHDKKAIELKLLS